MLSVQSRSRNHSRLSQSFADFKMCVRWNGPRLHLVNYLITLTHSLACSLTPLTHLLAYLHTYLMITVFTHHPLMYWFHNPLVGHTIILTHTHTHTHIHTLHYTLPVLSKIGWTLPTPGRMVFVPNWSGREVYSWVIVEWLLSDWVKFKINTQWTHVFLTNIFNTTPSLTARQTHIHTRTM